MTYKKIPHTNALVGRDFFVLHFNGIKRKVIFTPYYFLLRTLTCSRHHKSAGGECTFNAFLLSLAAQTHQLQTIKVFSSPKTAKVIRIPTEFKRDECTINTTLPSLVCCTKIVIINKKNCTAPVEDLWLV